jgi:hypothetical protein
MVEVYFMPAWPPRLHVSSDSGAYSAWKRKKKKAVDLDKYIQFIQRYQHLLDMYINLDVIGEDGEQEWQNWLTMRREGLNPVPVYHYGTDISYLGKYLDQTDYVALGGFAGTSGKHRFGPSERMWRDYLFDSIGYPRAKVHGLAITAPSLIAAFPWYSVDSISWTKYGSLGQICIPRGLKSGTPLYDQPPDVISVTPRSRDRKYHIDRLSTYRRLFVEDYLHQKGFTLGRGEKRDDDYEEGLRNTGPLRDALNAIYFLDVGGVQGKIVWLAGNFPAINDPRIERRIHKELFARGYDLYRMVTFFEWPTIKTVLDLKEEYEHEQR